MSEFNESQGVKTFRDDEFKIKLVDYQSSAISTAGLSVQPDGTIKSAGVNDFGAPVLFETDEATAKLVIPRTDPEGNVKVVIVDPSDSSKKISYHLHDSMAELGSDAHDYVVTSGKKAKSVKAILSSLSLVTWEIGSYNGVDTLTTWAKVVTSPASPVVEINLTSAELLGDGTSSIRILAVNRDRANDGYSTIQCYEEDA